MMAFRRSRENGAERLSSYNASWTWRRPPSRDGPPDPDSTVEPGDGLNRSPPAGGRTSTGLERSTTAAEMLRLCEALHQKTLVSKEASEAMLGHMRACDDKDKFPRFLPPGTKIAFKTGTVDEARTAAGNPSPSRYSPRPGIRTDGTDTNVPAGAKAGRGDVGE